MQYSPKQDQYFYKGILKHPDWQLVGNNAASNRFNWGLEGKMSYYVHFVYFIYVSEEAMVSVSVTLYYYNELWLDFTYYNKMYSELGGSLLFCFSKLMWYIQFYKHIHNEQNKLKIKGQVTVFFFFFFLMWNIICVLHINASSCIFATDALYSFICE
jgi:hypothetical protein